MERSWLTNHTNCVRALPMAASHLARVRVRVRVGVRLRVRG